jgi:type I restriction enzyme S subunit
MTGTHPVRLNEYDRAQAIVFLKTHDEFGGLSNMAGGFPLFVNGISILTSEALYQACRFPHLPDVQNLIISQRSPMAAKMKSKPHRTESRPDWDQVRVPVMRWCLRVKLAQNWPRFSHLLKATGDKPIVEESQRDTFWGAKPANDQTLVGENRLGQLLVQLRKEIHAGTFTASTTVDPPRIDNFLLAGQPIKIIAGRSGFGEGMRFSAP